MRDKFEKGEEPSEVEEESGENIVRCDVDGRRWAVRGTRAGVEYSLPSGVTGADAGAIASRRC